MTSHQHTGKLLLILLAAALSITSFDVRSQPAFEHFDQWKVAAVHDPMDAASQVILQTIFASSEQGALEGQNVEAFFGLRIFGGALITVHAPQSMGRNFWPYCDFNASTFSIAGQAPQPLATVRRGGSCNAIPVNGALIEALKQGQVVRLRLNRSNGYVSTKGFREAWRRAERLAR